MSGIHYFLTHTRFATPFATRFINSATQLTKQTTQYYSAYNKDRDYDAGRRYSELMERAGYQIAEAMDRTEAARENDSKKESIVLARPIAQLTSNETYNRQP